MRDVKKRDQTHHTDQRERTDAGHPCHTSRVVGQVTLRVV